MKTSSFLSLIFFTLTLLIGPSASAQKTALASPTPPIQTGGDVAATASAEVWLALVDDGQFEKSWENAAKILQGVVTKQNWQQLATEKRAPLGKVVSRKITQTTAMTSLPGAPVGQYVVLQFDTEFEHKKGAKETITVALESGWKVSGYYVR